MYLTIEVKQIITNIIQLGVPVCLQYVLGIVAPMLPNFFLGRVSPAALGGYSLGNMFVNFSGYAVITGFASNLDTHLSQAFGAKKYFRYQVVTLRNIVISLVMAIICGIIWGFVPQFFFALVGVRNDVALEATMFCRVMIFAIFPMFVGEIFHRYLSNQNIVVFPLLVNIPNIIICFFINYFYTTKYGVRASACSIIISFYVLFFSMGLYILVKGTLVQKKEKVDTMKLSRIKYFEGWKEIFRFGLPGIMMMIMDWGTFEINASFAGRINDVNLATHALLAQICTLCYMMPLGVSMATQIIVGQRLGEKQLHLSILAAKIGFFVTFSTMALALSFIYIFRYQYFHLCTDSKEIIDLGVHVIPVQITFSALDSIQCALTAILRGVGKQDVAWKFMLGYPLIGLPSGYIFAFVLNYKLMGVWMGMVAAVFTVDVCLFCLLYTVNWEKEQENAISRAGSGQDALLPSELSIVDAPAGHSYNSIPTDTCINRNQNILT
eukprot:g3440.t1